MRGIIIAAIAFPLAACGTAYVAAPPTIQAAPIELTLDCRDPVGVPVRELTQSEVEHLWGTDRRRLIECRDRHSGHVIFVTDRDKRLMGAQ